MRARRTRTLQLLAAGVGVALTAATLGGCASRTAQTGASTPAATAAGHATPTGTASATAPTTTSTPEPTATGTPTDGAPADQPTNGPNTLTSPASGRTIDGPDVTVTGTGTAFEASLSWEAVAAGSGAVVAQGVTMAGANGEVGPFTFVAALPSGRVTLSVWEPDMSDGASGTKRHNLVSVTFTVR
ncbi:MAG: Gmad2 immunoglobulin-like domain-containing protein [Cellulomonas sp.]